MRDCQVNQEIVSELYRTLVLLGAESDLLGTVGSWGDSLSDQDVLSNLKMWNQESMRGIKARIEQSEIPYRRQDDIPLLAPETSLATQ